MRIDNQQTGNGTGRGRAAVRRNGNDASALWTLTGVALLAACAHDDVGSFLESGGGATGTAAGGAAAGSSGMAALAAIAAVGIGVAASNGGGGTGSGNRGAPDSGRSKGAELETIPAYQLMDTMAEEGGPGDYPVSAQGQQAAPQRFTATHPDGEEFAYFVTSASGMAAGGNPRPAPAAGSQEAAFSEVFSQGEQREGSQRTPASRYDETSFNYGSMVEGAYGTLYYNSRDGRWTYEADPARVNPLKDGVTRQEAFLVTTVDARDVSSAAQRLVIAIIGEDETGGVNGRATWTDSTSSDPVKVGDRLTVTLTDSDGIPVDNPATLALEAPRFEFFHADDATGTNRTAVDRQYVTATAGNTGSVDVVEAHLGKYIGVEITYTDINGNPESVTAYADTTAAVAGHDAPGAAAFDPGPRPEVGTVSYTVRLTDPNIDPSGMTPASVMYQFFYADNADGTGNPTDMGAEKTRTAADGDRFSAELETILPEAATKFVGVEIAYDDGVGATDVVTAMLPQPVVQPRAGSGSDVTPPRNYGPTISPDNNKVDNLWWSVPAAHRGETPVKAVVFGERGYRNDPQHTPQDLLQLSVHPEEAGALTSRTSADAAENRANVIAEGPWGVDHTYDSKYGTWRFDRVDAHSARTPERLEEEGVLFWTYELGRTAEMRAAITADIGDRVSRYDQMFIQVSDGRDTDIIRLSVEIMGNGLTSLGRPDGHVPDPTQGAAPTLNPHQEDPHNLATPVFYEGGQAFGWDVLNKHLSETREFNYGDRDTDDAVLTIVYHLPFTPVVVKVSDWATDRTVLDLPRDYLAGRPERAEAIANGWDPDSGDLYNTGRNILVDPKNDPAHFQSLIGNFGTYNINRIDEHGDRVANGLEETGVLLWNYNLVGKRETGFRNDNVKRLNDGEFGFEIVYLQVHDNQGNKSDVRSLLVPIAGRNGNIGANVDTFGIGQVEQWWLDSYDELHQWDAEAATRTNNRGDGSFDDTMPEIGDTLTLTVTDVDGITATVTYAFFHAADPSGAGRTDISIGTGNTVAVTAAHAGRYIGVDVSYIDVFGNDEYFTRYTAAVRVPNTLGDASFDDATPQVGETLAVDVTDVDGATGTVTYAFFHADDTAGAGRTAIETNTTGMVTVAQAHAGKYIGVDITYTDDAGNPETITSYTAIPVARAPNNMGGATFDDTTPQVGETLAVDVTDTDGTNGVTISYAFFHADDTEGAGKTAIETNTTGMVTVVQAHDGKYIGVDITYTDELGNPESFTAYTAAEVAAANTAPTAGPASGQASTGSGSFGGFTVEQLMFMDADGDMLDHITVKTITGPGTLSLDAAAGDDAGAVSAGDDIAAGNIQHLTYMATSGTLGNGDLFTFSVNDGTDDSAEDYTYSIAVM